jgi:hypothetical protein
MARVSLQDNGHLPATPWPLVRRQTALQLDITDRVGVFPRTI